MFITWMLFQMIKINMFQLCVGFVGNSEILLMHHHNLDYFTTNKSHTVVHSINWKSFYECQNFSLTCLSRPADKFAGMTNDVCIVCHKYWSIKSITTHRVCGLQVFLHKQNKTQIIWTDIQHGSILRA